MVSRFAASFTGVLIPLALSTAAAFAQSGTIAGRVTDRHTDEPIASVRVEALTGGGRVVASAVTGGDGRFRLTTVATGTYRLSLTNVLGYREALIENVTVIAGQTTMVNASLVPSAFELTPLTVSVGRGRQEKITEAPASVSVVNQLAISERPAVSMTEHLRAVQGVDVIDAGVQSQNVTVRGFNNIFSGSLHMLTDFRIASVPSLRVNLLHLIPQTNEDIQRMEVVRGPASALYGPNTANGVLHVITKSPFDEQGNTVTLSGGERGVLQLTGRTSHLLTETLGVKLSGLFMRADDWRYVDPVEAGSRQQIDDPATRPLFVASMPRNPDGSPLGEAELDRRLNVIGVRDFGLERWAADARLDWRPTSDFRAVLSAGRTTLSSGVELTGIGAAQVSDWAYTYVQGRLHWRRAFAQAYVNTSDAGDTYLLRTGMPLVDRSKVAVAQLQRGTDIGDWQSFTYGVDYIRTMPETEGTIHGRREDDDTMDELGGYLQSTTRLTPKLDLVLAGRLDDHSHLPAVVFSPRAALVFRPAEDQSFRVTFNRAFSTPTSLNLFLDIDAGWAGDAIGPLGFRARAFGPGQHGIRFRDPAGGLFGMRSPRAAAVQPGADGATLLPADGRALYLLQVENFIAAAQLRGSPIPGPVADYLRSLHADPSLPTVFLALDPVTNQLFSPDQIQDVPGIRENITQSLEVGYKGALAERILVAADVWFDRKKNFTSPLLVQSPLLMMNPETVVPYLVQQLTAVFIGMGSSPEQAHEQGLALATQLASVPGAVAGSPDATAGGSDLIVTFRTFGEIELWGVDLGATAILTDNLQLGITASFVSADHFMIPLDGVTQAVALNAPARKGTAMLSYRNLVTGWHGELRVRHNASYPVNSAGFVGMRGCVDFDFGEAVINEPCVASFNLVDIGVGYRLPMLEGAWLQLSVQNVLNEGFRGFVGTPTLGRMALVRLRYDF